MIRQDGPPCRAGTAPPGRRNDYGPASGSRSASVSDSERRSAASLTRRDVLNVVWKLGLCAVIAPSVGRSAIKTPSFTQYPFALGVVSGDPTSTGIVLRTRLSFEPFHGCGHYEQGYFTAYRHMAEQRFDAIFRVGDYSHEYRPAAGITGSDCIGATRRSRSKIIAIDTNNTSLTLTCRQHMPLHHSS